MERGTSPRPQTGLAQKKQGAVADAVARFYRVFLGVRESLHVLMDAWWRREGPALPVRGRQCVPESIGEGEKGAPMACAREGKHGRAPLWPSLPARPTRLVLTHTIPYLRCMILQGWGYREDWVGLSICTGRGAAFSLFFFLSRHFALVPPLFSSSLTSARAKARHLPPPPHHPHPTHPPLRPASRDDGDGGARPTSHHARRARGDGQ